MGLFELFLNTAGAWLLYDTTEYVLGNVIQNAMPGFFARLVQTKTLRLYTSSAPALLHSIACTAWALYYICYGGWSVPYFSITYFVYDSVRGCTSSMLFHHVVASIMIFMSNTSVTDLPSMVAPYVLFTELSTIPLNMGVILCGPNKENQRLNLSQEEQDFKFWIKNSFFFTFMTTRMILLPYVIMWVFNEREFPGVFVLLVLQGMNIKWFFKMSKKSY